MAADPSIAFNALPPEQQQLMLDGPGLAPPPGIVPNFENPPNNTVIAHVALILCIIVTSIFVPIAFYSKVIRMRKLAWEDGFALIAILSWAVFVGFLYTAVLMDGYFIHQWDFQLREVTNYLQYFWVVTLTYFTTMAFIKVAIVYQWIHLFVPRDTKNAFYWVSFTIGWLNWAGCMTMMFLVAFSCQPTAKFWNPLLLGHCVDSIPTVYAAPIINLVFDVIALILPQRVIWGLHMDWRKRAGVSVLFTLGVLAILSAAFRIPASLKFAREDDRTYNISGTELWCLAEMTAGILIYCMPSAPMGFKTLKDGAKSARSKIGYGSQVSGTRSGVRKSKGSSASAQRSLALSTAHQDNPKSPYREIDQIPLTGMTPRVSGLQDDLESGLYDSNTMEKGGMPRTSRINVSSGRGLPDDLESGLAANRGGEGIVRTTRINVSSGSWHGGSDDGRNGAAPFNTGRPNVGVAR